MRMRHAGWEVVGALFLALFSAVRLVGETQSVDPYSLPVVQAACGAESGLHASPVRSGSRVIAPVAAGMARVYVITETAGLFESRGQPVRLGMDGHWFGVNGFYNTGYSYVDVAPGTHHLCVAAKVRDVLPHTMSGVLLARVDAVAGESYFFFDRCVRLAGIFTLQRINAEEGEMYLQALPTGLVPKLWKTPAAQAACGADPNQFPNDAQPPPSLPGPPAPGHALVYFFNGVPRFGGSGSPIRIGVDGHWMGWTHTRSYVALQVTPGVHRLCTATKIMVGMKPELNLSTLNLVAGRTYFVDTATMQPEDHSLATMWLRRFAAMPKSDHPDWAALKRANRAIYPYSQDDLRACGLPTTANSNAAVPKAPEPKIGAQSELQANFLFLSNNGLLLPRYPLNIGIDGHWAASLRRTSWVSLPVAVGQHRVCIYLAPSKARGNPAVSRESRLYLAALDTTDAYTLNFETRLFSDPESGLLYGNGRLDPDEAALLMAYFPRVGTLHR